MARLIDARELLERLTKKKPEVANKRYTEGFNDAIMRFRSMVHGAPIVDAVEVRRGKWVWNENGMDWGLGAWECSECHRKPETWWEADKGNPYRCAGSSYCNNCGAKMGGGVGEEE